MSDAQRLPGDGLAWPLLTASAQASTTTGMATKKTSTRAAPATAASASMASASMTTHPITMVRARFTAAKLEKALLAPLADVVPALFRHSRRGARLAERLVADRPLLSLSAALAELAGHVQDPERQRAWSPNRSPVAAGIPRILVDKLAYALHCYVDVHGAVAVPWGFAFGDHVAPPPVPRELLGLVAALDDLEHRLGAPTEAVSNKRRARVSLDEGPPPGFFYTEDTAAVPRGMLLSLDDVSDQKPLHFVGVRGPLLDVETQRYALQRVLDIVKEPLFDEGPRLVRLAGGRFGALLAALSALTETIDDDGTAAHVVWRVQHRSTVKGGGFIVRPHVRRAGSDDVERVDVAEVAGLPCATDHDTAVARAAHAAGGDRLDGSVGMALLHHGHVELHDGRPLKVSALEPTVEVRDDHHLVFSAGGLVVDAAALADDGSAVTVDADAGRLLVVKLTAQQKELARAVVALGDVALPARVVDDVVRRLKRSRLDVRVPQALRGERRAPSAKLTVRVSWRKKKAGGHGGAAFSVVARPIDSGATFVPGIGPVVVFGDDGGRAVYCERSLIDEDRVARDVVDSVVAAGVVDAEDIDGAFSFTLLAPERAYAALAVIAARDDVVLALSAEGPRVQRASARELRVQFTQRTDWLGVDGGVQLDNGTRLALQPILEALRQGRRYVVVDNDRVALLSSELQAELAGLAAYAIDGKVHHAALAMVKDAAAGLAGAGATVDANIDFSAVAAANDVDGRAPAGVQATLRPYQEEGLRFLRRLALFGGGGILADDMGLGKTIVTLCALADRAALGPQIVVAPTSLCFHWQNELLRFAPGLRPVLLVGDDRADRQERIAGAGPGDVVISSYGVVQRLKDDAFAHTSFATLVVDEAQAVKNASTSRAQALRRVSARLKVALTGTPVENHLGELWSILDLVAPGLFGSFTQWKARWALPIEKDDDKERRAVLARALRPFILRRKKSEVARELPQKTVTTRVLEPTPDEAQAYQRLRLALIADLDESQGVVRNARGDPDPRQKTDTAQTAGERRMRLLAALTKLRLCACHPSLVADVADVGAALMGTKQRAMVDLVDELRDAGHKTLVFSQFVMHLNLAKRFLEESGASVALLTGDTPIQERARLVEAFQRGDYDVFLISLKAGGFGLNLTRASYVIHLDPWWNPAAEEQASDRAHRIGQTLPVTIVRLVMGGTLEEPILALHERKRALADDVLAGTDVAGALSLSELVDLIQTSRRFDGAPGNELAQGALPLE